MSILNDLTKAIVTKGCPHLFFSLARVQELIWAWMASYNEERPHELLGNLSPSEFKTEINGNVSSYELCA